MINKKTEKLQYLLEPNIIFFCIEKKIIYFKLKAVIQKNIFQL